MDKKTKEHSASVLKEIKAEVNDEVIKDYRITDLCNIDTAKVTGFAVIMTLCTRYDYTSNNLENWRKRLDADDYFISVNRNRLQVRFNIMY